jgi:CBS-domain-containing membrane protein
MLRLTGPHAWAAAAAVGLAVLAMYLTGTFHPPAGINPLLVVSNSLPWSFLLAPVLAGAVLLTVFAWLWHRWIRRRPWPARWL